jgi:chromatin remodeling complex protein RSC6
MPKLPKNNVEDDDVQSSSESISNDKLIYDNKFNSDEIFVKFDSIVNSLTNFKNQINIIQHQMRLLEKDVKKQMKNYKKVLIKSKNKGSRKPSGFANPTKVTKQLCEFMNKKEGSEIARTEVTRALINYIKTNNLQDKTNKKVIAPDDKLKVLLDIDENQELTYFNLQKYMNKHFISSNELL